MKVVSPHKLILINKHIEWYALEGIVKIMNDEVWEVETGAILATRIKP